ncbi:hypothetical protein OE766_21065 [Pararhizobium sp. YC-54]|uniref:hypothetical protein n=1 Tax=Pararhizobium sp. YC-54 TaxID=2986920 RepID=UPI0021F6DB15|nr:hypothetical protein [Pararhizobium sp. YC-54]MCW0000726.1 hypothetical protein [Pararhizobium sp. YC-54]
MTSILSLLGEALGVETIKLIGIEFAKGTKFMMVACLWIFVGEAFVTFVLLVKNWPFLATPIAAYGLAALLAIGGSIGHLYSGLYYRSTSIPLLALTVCTAGNCLSNYYTQQRDQLPYMEALMNAWMISTAFGSLLVFSWALERMLLAAQESTPD